MIGIAASGEGVRAAPHTYKHTYVSSTVVIIAKPTMQRQRRFSFLRSINILHGNNPYLDADDDIEEIDDKEEQVEFQGLIDNEGRPIFDEK